MRVCAQSLFLLLAKYTNNIQQQNQSIYIPLFIL